MSYNTPAQDPTFRTDPHFFDKKPEPGYPSGGPDLADAVEPFVDPNALRAPAESALAVGDTALTGVDAETTAEAKEVDEQAEVSAAVTVMGDRLLNAKEYVYAEDVSDLASRIHYVSYTTKRADGSEQTHRKYTSAPYDATNKEKQDAAPFRHAAAKAIIEANEAIRELERRGDTAIYLNTEDARKGVARARALLEKYTRLPALDSPDALSPQEEFQRLLNWGGREFYPRPGSDTWRALMGILDGRPGTMKVFKEEYGSGIYDEVFRDNADISKAEKGVIKAALENLERSEPAAADAAPEADSLAVPNREVTKADIDALAANMKTLSSELAEKKWVDPDEVFKTIDEFRAIYAAADPEMRAAAPIKPDDVAALHTAWQDLSKIRAAGNSTREEYNPADPYGNELGSIVFNYVNRRDSGLPQIDRIFALTKHATPGKAVWQSATAGIPYDVVGKFVDKYKRHFVDQLHKAYESKQLSRQELDEALDAQYGLANEYITHYGSDEEKTKKAERERATYERMSSDDYDWR